MKRRLTALLILGLATTAAAHTGVKDARVMAWMENMMLMADHTKVLGQMASGERAFDAAAAQAAAEGIAVTAAATPALFSIEASDPKSEALPAIWEKPEAFNAIAAALEADALSAAGSVESPDALGQVMRTLGQHCRACHQEFRE